MRERQAEERKSSASGVATSALQEKGSLEMSASAAAWNSLHQTADKAAAASKNAGAPSKTAWGGKANTVADPLTMSCTSKGNTGGEGG